MSVLNKLIVSLVTLMTVAVGAVAANYSSDSNFRIYCTTIAMPSDGVVTASLLLDNPQGYGDMRRAFQVDVTLPAGYGFVATNGRYAAPSSGITIHEHLFNESGVNKLRLVFKAEQTVVAATGREICSLTLKQIDRTLQQSSTIGFSNFIYVRAASTSGHYGAEQNVTLNPYVYATAVTLNKTSLEMFYRDTYKLTATLTPASSPAGLKWTSSNTAVATVDDNGLVTTQKCGSTTITVATTDGTNLSATCALTVTGITAFALNKTSATINVGDNLQLTTNVTPQVASSIPVNWSTSNSSIATVDDNGMVTAHRAGTATITATTTATTTSGAVMTAQCELTVKGATSLTFDNTSVTMYAGETATIKATVAPSRYSSMALTWQSSNTNVATVDGNGVITAVRLGSTKVTATTTDGSALTASCDVTVAGATSVTLSKTSLSIYRGDNATLKATILPGRAASMPVAWSSSNKNIATVDEIGVVTGVGVGVANITATTTDDSDLSASCQVTVKGIENVSFDKTSLELYYGESATINATISPARYSSLPLSWKSSNTQVVTVDAGGIVKAVGLGEAKVTATTTDGTGIVTTCDVTVHGASSLTLDKTSITLYYGEANVINATVTPDRSALIPLRWRSSNVNVATVNPNGMVTAVAMGSATITATTTDGSNLTASCNVTVSGTESLTLDKSSLVMFTGETARLTAIVLPSRATGKALSWTSSSTSVATVDATGNVTSKGVGTVTITVATTDGTGLKAQCAVTVTPDYTLLVDTISHIRGSERVARAVNVSLANRNAISAMQFDLTLPSYMTMAYYDGYPDIWLDGDRKSRNHSVDISKTSSSSQQYRVIVSSPTNKTFSGNGGAVLHFNVLINQYPNSTGNYSIELSNIVLSEADETQHTISKVTGNVKYGYLVGDANADVIIDVSDYVLTANKILQRSVTNFWSDAANAAYNDNTINVTDLVAITNIALDLRDKEIRSAPAMRGATREVTLSLGEQEADGGATVGLSLNSDVAVAALQADVTLPEGVTLDEAQATGRAARYAVESATLPDGRVRLLMSQFGDAVIAAGEGDIVTLTLAGKATDDATMTVDDAVVTERDLTTHYPEGAEMQLTTLTGVADVIAAQPRIYIEDGAVAIDSPTAGVATVATVDGRSMSVEVQAGHNVYRVPEHGVYIVYLNGTVAKLAL